MSYAKFRIIIIIYIPYDIPMFFFLFATLDDDGLLVPIDIMNKTFMSDGIKPIIISSIMIEE